MVNPYIDTLIGVAVIYFIFSVFAYVIQEFWASMKESRGKMLRKAIYDLLNDNLNKGYGVLLFDHPQFNFLKKTDNRLPSYLPASNFADALVDLISREAYDLYFPEPTEQSGIKFEDASGVINKQTPVKMGSIAKVDLKTLTAQSGNRLPVFLPDSEQMFELFKDGLSQMKTSNLKMLLQNILANSKNHESLRKNIETWYDDYMDRVTGWYKSKVSINLRWIGLALAIIFNVQAFHIITTIYSDRQLRDKLIKTGETIINNDQFFQPIYSSNLSYALETLDSNCEKQLNQLEADSAIKNKDIIRIKIQEKCLEDRMALADSFARLRYKQALAITDSLKLWELPIGWKLLSEPGTPREASGVSMPNGGRNWFWVIVGWIVTGLAISAGAPFWFNVLNKLFDIRRAGIKPNTTIK